MCSFILDLPQTPKKEKCDAVREELILRRSPRRLNTPAKQPVCTPVKSTRPGA